MNDTDIAIRSQGLTRRFGTLTAVDKLDLQIPRASIYGFLGPNGSGKSTTIRMLCGLLLPSAGTAQVMDYQIPRQAEQLKTHIGYMTQRFSLYDDLSVQENLQFISNIYALPWRTRGQRINNSLTRFNLQALRLQRAGTLSGGQKQRLALAGATLHQPQLLFLDEPTSAVDPQSRRDFWATLFELVNQGTTILVSTHYMDEAERCHGLAIIDAGIKVADGSPPQLMANINANVVKIEAPSVGALTPLLANTAQIYSATQLGVHLRILISKQVNDPVAFVKQRCKDSPQTLHVTRTQASLEDVFVMATRKTTTDENA